MNAEVHPIKSAAWKKRLLLTKDRTAYSMCVANANVILANDPRWVGVLAFDSFAQEVITTRKPPWDDDDAPPNIEIGPWSEQDDVRLAAWFSRHWPGLKLTPAVVRSAVDVIARKRERHPVREYLEGLRWDGSARVFSWLTTYLSVASSEYSSAVGRIILISAVARIFEHGAKVDTMAVLEGAQGARKSTLIKKLFSPWNSDTPPDLASKDRFVALRGRWGIEWSELDGFARGDHARLKGFLSSAEDDFRPPYARANVRIKRQCVFIGTANRSDYLTDATGNRRYLPVVVGRVDLEAFERDRDQLWAEAVELYHQGGQVGQWWPDSELLPQFREEQSARVSADSWQEIIEEFLAKPTKRTAYGQPFITVGEVLERALGMDPQDHDQARQNRVSKVLLMAGWEPCRPTFDGQRVHGYFLPAVRVAMVGPGSGVEGGQT